MKCAEWCTHQNLKEMYNKVYSYLVTRAYELVHPGWLVFTDEVGSNTSQVKMVPLVGKLTSVRKKVTHKIEQQHRMPGSLSLDSL